MKATHKLPDGRLACKQGKWWFVYRDGLWWPVSGDLSEIYQLEKIK